MHGRVRLCVLRDLFTLLFALRVATSCPPTHDAGCDETVAPSGARPRRGQGTTRAHRPRRNPQNLLQRSLSTCCRRRPEALRNVPPVTGASDMVRVVLALIPPHRVENPGEATRQR